MREIWKDIKGYEQCYQVSNFGNVKSCAKTIYRKYKNENRNIKKNERILKQSIASHGYYTVSFCRNMKFDTRTVHSLVAREFIGESNGMFVNHKDLNKLNNNIDNLEYVSKQENSYYQKKRIGTSSVYKGVHFNKAMKRWTAQIQKDKKLYRLGVFNDEKEAAIEYDKYAVKLFGKNAFLNMVHV